MYLNKYCRRDELFEKDFNFPWYFYLTYAIAIFLELLIMFTMALQRRTVDNYEDRAQVFHYGAFKLPVAPLAISLSLVGIYEQSAHKFYKKPSISFIIVSARIVALLMMYPFWKLLRKSDLSTALYIHKRFPTNSYVSHIFSIVVFLSSLYSILNCKESIISSSKALGLDYCATIIIWTLFSSILYKYGGMKTVCWIAVLRMLLILLGKLSFLVSGFVVLSTEDIQFFRRNETLVFYKFGSSLRYFVYCLVINFMILFSNHGGLQFFTSTSSGKDATLVAALSIIPFALITVLSDITSHIVRTYYKSKNVLPGGHINAPPCLYFYYFLLDSSTHSIIYALMTLSDMLLGSFQIIISMQSIWIELVHLSQKWKCLKMKDMYELRVRGIVFIGILQAICLTLLLNQTITGYNVYGTFIIVMTIMLILMITLIWLAGIFPQINSNSLLPTLICGVLSIMWMMISRSYSITPATLCQRNDGGMTSANGTITDDEVGMIPVNSVTFYAYAATLVIQVITIFLVTKLCKRQGKATDDDLYVEMALTYWTNYYVRRRFRRRKKKPTLLSRICEYVCPLNFRKRVFSHDDKVA